MQTNIPKSLFLQNKNNVPTQGVGLLLNGLKITALYLRASREDELEGESNTILNQRALLMDYAKKNDFKNVKVFADDGKTGVNFNRKEFQKLLKLIEAGEVETLIVKDMSRLGSNHVEVGYLTETILKLHDVRFIAVNDGVDSEKGDDDFTPFRNIMNEWYAKDMSRKIRSTLRLKSSQGFAIGTNPPYGYVRGEDDKKKWVIDPESAENIRNIYEMRRQGYSINEIADKLRYDKILIPSIYMEKKGIRKMAHKTPLGEFIWSCEKVRKILTNQSYAGDVINFKTYSKSFKLKKRLENPQENWVIYKDVHPAITEHSEATFCSQSRLLLTVKFGK